jgi:large subunit ribosomal protein L18
MRKGARYNLPFKRRYEGKTDYRQRLSMLYSKQLRLVVRISAKQIKAQIVKFKSSGDETLIYASTSDLKKLGWENAINNMPSAYLLGFLIGKKALKQKINSAILDTGLQRNIKGSKLYAVLKGALDAGLNIPHNPEILPSEDRIKGKHITDYAQKLKKEDAAKYKKHFSISQPEKISEIFEKVKSEIVKG